MIRTIITHIVWFLVNASPGAPALAAPAPVAPAAARPASPAAGQAFLSEFKSGKLAAFRRLELGVLMNLLGDRPFRIPVRGTMREDFPLLRLARRSFGGEASKRNP